MNIKLRTKAIIWGMMILVLYMFVSTLITSLVIRNQNREGAIRYLQQSFIIIGDYIKNRQAALLEHDRRIAGLEWIGNEIRFFSESKSSGDADNMMEHMIRESSRALFDTVLMQDLSQLALYDKDGDLFCFFIFGEDEVTAGHVYKMPGRLGYKMTKVKRGAEIPEDGWQPVDHLEGVEMHYKGVIPAGESAGLRTMDQQIEMVSLVPILSGQEVIENGGVVVNTEQVGFIMMTRVIDHLFIARLDVLTGTRVNLLVDDQFAIGTEKGYKTMDPHLAEKLIKRIDDKSPAMGEPVIADSVHGGEEFFEGVLPLYSSGKKIGSIVSLYSKEIFRKNTLQMIEILILVSLACLIFIMLPASLVFSCYLNKLTKNILNIFEKLAEGNLRERMNILSGDELGLMAKAYNATIDEVAKLIKKIKGSIEIIRKSSSEIEASATTQSAAATQQASSIHGISSTMRQIADSSKEMAKNVALVVGSSQNTLGSSIKANEVMENSLGGMEEIKKSARLTSSKILSLGEKSRAIGDIVEIIKDVTSQTNLLALNASIEATKAGEAGKGFSIVAEEIRRLAENTAESTKEIKDIVLEIQNAVNGAVIATEEETKRIEKGVNLAIDAKAMLEDINKATREATGTAEQIGESIRHQDMATQDVFQSVSSIAEGVKQGAEENTRITKSLVFLAKISKTLDESIGQFKLNGDEEADG